MFGSAFRDQNRLHFSEPVLLKNKNQFQKQIQIVFRVGRRFNEHWASDSTKYQRPTTYYGAPTTLNWLWTDWGPKWTCFYLGLIRRNTKLGLGHMGARNCKVRSFGAYSQ